MHCSEIPKARDLHRASLQQKEKTLPIGECLNMRTVALGLCAPLELWYFVFYFCIDTKVENEQVCQKSSGPSPLRSWGLMAKYRPSQPRNWSCVEPSVSWDLFVSQRCPGTDFCSPSVVRLQKTSLGYNGTSGRRCQPAHTSACTLYSFYI